MNIDDPIPPQTAPLAGTPPDDSKHLVAPREFPEDHVLTAGFDVFSETEAHTNPVGALLAQPHISAFIRKGAPFLGEKLVECTFHQAAIIQFVFEHAGAQLPVIPSEMLDRCEAATLALVHKAIMVRDDNALNEFNLLYGARPHRFLRSWLLTFSDAVCYNRRKDSCVPAIARNDNELRFYILLRMTTILDAIIDSFQETATYAEPAVAQPPTTATCANQ